jgi:hypothetical protein
MPVVVSGMVGTGVAVLHAAMCSRRISKQFGLGGFLTVAAYRVPVVIRRPRLSFSEPLRSLWSRHSDWCRNQDLCMAAQSVIAAKSAYRCASRNSALPLAVRSPSGLEATIVRLAREVGRRRRCLNGGRFDTDFDQSPGGSRSRISARVSNRCANRHSPPWMIASPACAAISRYSSALARSSSEVRSEGSRRSFTCRMVAGSAHTMVGSEST